MRSTGIRPTDTRRSSSPGAGRWHQQAWASNPVRARAQPDQDLGADTLTLAGQAEQDVLGADIAVTEPLRLAEREFEHLLACAG